jgi:hypothetical protein
MNVIKNILGKDVHSRNLKTCKKGLLWSEENEDNSGLCENCVKQFNCKKSNWQPKKRK